jgi:hypothetical protein
VFVRPSGVPTKPAELLLMPAGLAIKRAGLPW